MSINAARSVHATGVSISGRSPLLITSIKSRQVRVGKACVLKASYNIYYDLTTPRVIQIVARIACACVAETGAYLHLLNPGGDLQDQLAELPFHPPHVR